jgi:hypothetical protein
MACLRSPTSVAGREPTRAGGASSYDLQSGARALCSRAVNNAGVANTTDAGEDGILNDSYWRLHGGGCGDGGRDDDDDYNHGCEVSYDKLGEFGLSW